MNADQFLYTAKLQTFAIRNITQSFAIRTQMRSSVRKSEHSAAANNNKLSYTTGKSLQQRLDTKMVIGDALENFRTQFSSPLTGEKIKIREYWCEWREGHRLGPVAVIGPCMDEGEK